MKRLLYRESELLELAEELQPMLPIDDLDLLVPDEIGKNVSDIGMDTNVAGRMRIHDKPEPTFIDRPAPRARPDRRDARQHQRNRAGRLLSPAGCQARRRDHYVCNSVTGGQPERGAMLLAVLSNRIALQFAYSAMGVASLSEMQIARILNTLEPDELLVSEPVATRLTDHPDVTVEDLRPLRFDNRDPSAPWDWDHG